VIVPLPPVTLRIVSAFTPWYEAVISTDPGATPVATPDILVPVVMVAIVVSDEDQAAEFVTLTDIPLQVAVAVRDCVDPTDTDAFVGMIERAVTVPLAQVSLPPPPLIVFGLLETPPHPKRVASVTRRTASLRQ